MKSLIFCICVICSVFDLYGQKNGEISYDFVMPSITKGSVTTSGLLEFNDSVTLFSYYKLGLIDSEKQISNFYFDSTKGAILMASNYDQIGTQVYRNFRNEKIILRQGTVKPLQPFNVIDDWIPIDWKIVDGKKEILGYVCQNAIGNFRGREYNVWFAPTIALPYGPWKLYGLPGLILEAHDSQNMVHLTAKKIINLDTIFGKILVSSPESIVKTIKEYATFKDFYMENVELGFKKELSKINGLTIKLDKKDRTTTEKIVLQREFNLESKYEWEMQEQKMPKSSITIHND